MIARTAAIQQLAKVAQGPQAPRGPLGTPDNPYNNILDASTAVASSNSNASALRQLAAIAMIAGGGGMLARGLQGAKRLLNKTIQAPGLGKVVTLPILEKDEEEKTAQGNPANSITAASWRNAKPAPNTFSTNPMAAQLPEAFRTNPMAAPSPNVPQSFRTNPMAAPNTFSTNPIASPNTAVPQAFRNNPIAAPTPNSFNRNITTRQSGTYPANFFSRNMLSRPQSPGFGTNLVSKQGGSEDAWGGMFDANAWENFLSGRKTPSTVSKPWFIPAALAASLGGGYLGWKGTDAILDARRKAESEEELQLAEEAFRQAMLSNYSGNAKPGSMSKAAELGMELDRLYDDTVALAEYQEKNASATRDALGLGLGLYGGYASLSALLAGLWAHRVASKRSRSAVLEKALKKRQRDDYVLQPAELYALPEHSQPAR